MPSHAFTKIWHGLMLWLAVFGIGRMSMEKIRVSSFGSRSDSGSMMKEMTGKKGIDSNLEDYLQSSGKPSATVNIEFVSFPYRTLGDTPCHWETPSLDQAISMGYLSKDKSPDATQQALLEEGICVPTNVSDKSELDIGGLHLFSSLEALECLQAANGRVAIAGDSYTMQLYIGLADILLGRSANAKERNVEVHNYWQRRRMLNQSIAELFSRWEEEESFPKVEFICYSECREQFPFSKHCSACLNDWEIETKKNHNTAIIVVGAGAHVIKACKGGKGEKRIICAVNEVQDFFGKAPGHVFVSTPAYQRGKIPRKYRKEPHHARNSFFYERILPHVAPQNPSQPFLDVFQLTGACDMDNCTADGGHRARFVNRWKAQWLLNTLCKVK